MAGNQKFFLCKHCKNLIGMIDNNGVPLVCCGEKMEELIPNSVDAANEKHVPSVTQDGDTITVSVGSTLHPMEVAHNIEFVYVETENGGQRKKLTLDNPPKATFCLIEDKAVAVYAYCNLHGLWRYDLG